MNEDDLFKFLKNYSVEENDNIDDNLDDSDEIKDSLESKDTTVCSTCKSESLYSDKGMHICINCGTVQDRVLDSSAEWRFYGSDDSKSSDPTRCGLPINNLLPESSLGSVIGLKGFQSLEMQKIRKYHTWNSMPYKERSLYNVFDSLTIRATNNGISTCIIEEAKAMYKILSEAKISRGSNRKGLIASCIYTACKIKKVPRSAKEIADIFDLNITNMTKGCKKALEIINSSRNSNMKDLNLPATKPEDFVHRFCCKLNVSGDFLEKCINIANKADKNSIVSENTPPSIAAGSIYLIAIENNIGLSKKDISIACKISEVTISKCYKKMSKYKRFLLTD